MRRLLGAILGLALFLLCPGPAAAQSSDIHAPVELGFEPIPEGGVDLIDGVKLHPVSDGATPLWLGSDDKESEQSDTVHKLSNGPVQQEAADEK